MNPGFNIFQNHIKSLRYQYRCKRVESQCSDEFCLHCLRHANLDGAAIAAEMNIVSAAADGGRIHAVTRAALSSIPDGPDRFWRHLCDALKGAALLEDELGRGDSICDVQLEGGRGGGNDKKCTKFSSLWGTEKWL